MGMDEFGAVVAFMHWPTLAGKVCAEKLQPFSTTDIFERKDGIVFVCLTKHSNDRLRPISDRNPRSQVLDCARPRIRCAVLALWIVSSLGCLGCQSGPRPAPTPAALPTSAQAGDTTIVAVAGPSPAKATLPEFLGIGQLFGGLGAIGQRVRNRLGSRFPFLETKPPLLAISDPANMSADAPPAVKAAAEAKAEEDKAPQKAKAIRYLASLGCGECYPDTEDAFLDALEDCTELVRYETVMGLRSSAGDPCQRCRENSCCSPKLLKKLNQLAYEVDDKGCNYESSSRVRRNARLALRACGGYQPEASSDVPEEGPTETPPVPPEEEPAEPVAAIRFPPTEAGQVL
jgi:hypothetical protein